MTGYSNASLSRVPAHINDLPLANSKEENDNIEIATVTFLKDISSISTLEYELIGNRLWSYHCALGIFTNSGKSLVTVHVMLKDESCSSFDEDVVFMLMYGPGGTANRITDKIL